MFLQNVYLLNCSVIELHSLCFEDIRTWCYFVIDGWNLQAVTLPSGCEFVMYLRHIVFSEEMMAVKACPIACHKGTDREYRYSCTLP